MKLATSHRVFGPESRDGRKIPGQKTFLADATFISGEASHVQVGLQSGSKSFPVEAWLTEDVERLRSSWRSFSTRNAVILDLIRTQSTADVDQNELSPILDELFQFADLLLSLEIFLLFPEQLALQHEETVLSLKNLIVELGDGCRKLVEISQTDRRFAEFLRGCNRHYSCIQKRNVHGNPRIVVYVVVAITILLPVRIPT